MVNDVYVCIKIDICIKNLKYVLLHNFMYISTYRLRQYYMAILKYTVTKNSFSGE